MIRRWIFVFFLELVITLWVGRSLSQIVLSEIMFNPKGNERYDEFIEIFNTSESDTIDLQGWLLSDGEGYNRIQPGIAGSRLTPQSFAVIFVPSYYQQSRYYDALIPPGVLTLTIDKSMFGSYGLNNSRSEKVSLCKPDTTIISSYAYSVPNDDGISEEKIILTGGDHPTNWSHSKVINGTPGRRNSVSPLDYDLALTENSCRILPRSNDASDSLDGIIYIHNRGMKPAKGFQVSILWDSNQDNEPQSEESIMMINPTQAIPPQDSLFFQFVLRPLPWGQQRLWVCVDFSLDENPVNNVIERMVNVAVPPAKLLLNECMTNPKPGSYWWLELVNADSVAIDLKGYRLLCPQMGKEIILSIRPFTILPNHYLLLCPGNNFTDDYWPAPCPVVIISDHWPTPFPSPISLYLLDEKGKKIDSLRWSHEQPQGVSLERNGITSIWDYCCHPLGATPGARNSIAAPFADAALQKRSIKISPNPLQFALPISFSLRIDNFGTLPCFLKEMECRRIDAYGSHSDTVIVATIPLFRQLAPHDSSTFFYEVPPLRPGSYQFLFTLRAEGDAYPMNNSVLIDVLIPYQRGAIVINELFYNTEEKQQEWIELYNPSNVTFDLHGFIIKDAHKSTRIGTTLPLLPDHYLVLSNQFFADPADPSFTPFVIPSLPELNNTGDQIVLASPEGFCIDSVAYSSNWGGARFVSLERVRWEDGSNDPRNWRSCNDPSGSTPGRANSCSPKQIDAAIVSGSLTFSPTFPIEGEETTITCLVENAGRNFLERVSLQFYLIDDNGHEELLDQTELEALMPRQKREVAINWQNPVAGTCSVCCSLQLAGDQNHSNDRECRRLMIGYKQSPIVINEIMYSPLEGEPEWIEFYNRSNYAVNVENWRLSDADTLKKVIVTPSRLVVKPHGYWVIAADSLTAKIENDSVNFTILKNWPILNNEADAVVLYDWNGRVVDRVDYAKEWGGAKGRSLERLNPYQPSTERTNWATCAAVAGHTAGRRNSVFFDVLPPVAALELAPVPFSPDGDGFEDYLAISYRLPVQTARVNIRIFDRNGNLVRFLCNYEHSGSQATKFWDGLDGEGRRCRMGLYIVHLQAFDEYEGKLMETKKVCVLALRL